MTVISVIRLLYRKVRFRRFLYRRVDTAGYSNTVWRRQGYFTQKLREKQRRRLMLLYGSSLLAGAALVIGVASAILPATELRADAPDSRNSDIFAGADSRSADRQNIQATDEVPDDTVESEKSNQFPQARGVSGRPVEPAVGLAAAAQGPEPGPDTLATDVAEGKVVSQAPAVYPTDWQGDFLAPAPADSAGNQNETEAMRLGSEIPGGSLETSLDSSAASPDRPGLTVRALPLPQIEEEVEEEPLVDAALRPIPAWKRHAVKLVGLDEDERPRIAVVIDDIGLNRDRTLRVLQLPRPLTLAFLPYGQPVSGLVTRARAVGHEVIVHLPMEPHSEDQYPGPHALYTHLTDAEVTERLEWNLSRFSGFVGVSNHMGSRFTQNEKAMRVLFATLRQRGLLYLDSVTSQRSVGFRLARSEQIPVARRDVFLDHDATRAAILKQISVVEDIARSRGSAVAIGHPYNSTLSLLGPWLETLTDRGFRLVPISAIVSAPKADTAMILTDPIVHRTGTERRKNSDKQQISLPR